jgi:glycosyltransferase involved in cell wall biosynthesis
MTRVALSTSVVQRGKSGVASYVFGLLDGLRGIRAPIDLTLIGLADDKPLFEKWLDFCAWETVPERWRSATRNVFWHQTLLRGVLKKLRADVLHVPSYRRIVWRPPCAQVVTVHDCAAFAVQGKYDAARMFYGRHIVTRLARQADALIAVSQATAGDMQRYFGVPADEVKVVWNGVDHATFRPQAEARVRDELAARFAQARLYYFYLARLEHPGKNHVALIEAFELFAARFPDRGEDLVFAGADWHGAAAIHARIASSPIRNRIRSLGFLGKSDLPLWYSGATAMVYPSLFEGFGLPPVEAMACGCPVICSPRGSLREIAGDAARFIEPEDISGIASALGEMTVETRAAWIPRGISRASQFAWMKTAEAVLGIYLAAK